MAKAKKKAKAKTKAKATEVEQIEIREPQMVTVRIEIEGTSGLVMHRWSEKALAAMMMAQSGKAKESPEPKDPDACMEGATYYIDKENREIRPPADLAWIAAGEIKRYEDTVRAWAERMKTAKNRRFGFPSVAFKAAMVRAGKQHRAVMIDLQCLLYIPCDFIHIRGERRRRQDMVRVGNGKADIRFRPEFMPWSATIPVTFNRLVMSADKVYNLLATAGYGVGIGEMRPERGGNQGTFRVVK